MNKYQVKIEDTTLPDYYTLDELIDNGLLDERDEQIKVRAISETKWVIARDYPFHLYEQPTSTKYTINEFGEIVRQGAAISNLTVSRTSLSFSATGSSQSISITSSSSWSISVNAASWVHLNRNGNTLSVRVDSNYSSDSRSDYFKIKAGDKEEKISIYQSGKTTTSSSTSSDDDYSGCLWWAIGIGIVIAICCL